MGRARLRTRCRSSIEWTASDDVTAETELSARADIQRLLDPADPYIAELIESRPLPAGSTNVSFETGGGAVYRVDVVIADASATRP